MIRTAAIFFTILISLFPVFVQAGEGNPPALTEAGGQTVRIGVLARRGPEQCVEHWGPTAEYLQNRIQGFRFQIVPLSFEKVTPAVQNREVDFVIANSSIYVELQALFGASRMATMKDRSFGQGATLFGGLIFSRADRADIVSIEDLKGKSFMAVDETSLGGWRAAWREFKEKGIDPYRDFSSLSFAGTHDAVVFAVRVGKADAGTIATPLLEEMIVDGVLDPGLFKVINAQGHADFPYAHSTRLYPNWPFAKLKHTPNALAERVVIALLDMPSDSPAAKASESAGWTVPLDYGAVDACLKDLRVGMYKGWGKISISEGLKIYRWHITLTLLAISSLAALLIITLHLNRDLRSSKSSLQNEIIERKQAEAALKRMSDQNRLILLSAGEGILGLDLEGNISFINPAAVLMMGWDGLEMIGRSHHIFLQHPDPSGSKSNQEECPILDALRSGKVVSAADDTFWRKDGESFPVEYLCTPIIEESRPCGAVITFRDITERKHTAEALRNNEEQFRALVESGPDAIYIQSEGCYAYVNDAAVKLYGARTKEELLGKPIVDRLHPACKAEVLDQIQSINEKKSVPISEHKHLKLDGTIIDVEVSAVPVSYQNQDGGLVFVRDITERKQTEQALLLSEERYRRLFEDADLGIFRSTLDGKLINVNPAYARMYGFDSPGEAINSVNDIAVDLYEDPSRRIADVRTILESEEPIRVENRYRRKGGGSFIGNLHAWAVRDEEGKFLYLEGFIEDITERKKAEEVLRLTQFSVEHAADPIYWTGPGGEILYANEAARISLGYSKEELSCLTVQEIDPRLPADKWLEHWERTKQRCFLTIESEHRRKDGSTFPVEISVNFLEFNGREFNFAYCKDISARKQTEDERQKLERQLQHSQKMEAIGTLAGGIAHDFNNILSAIFGYTDLALAHISDDNPIRRNLEQVFKAGHRARDLIRQILIFSRTKPGQDLQPTKIGKVIVEVLKFLRASLPATIEIRHNIGDEESIALADPTQVHQLVTNLCTNAFHAMDETGGTLEVSTTSVELTQNSLPHYPNIKPGPYIRLTIKDTGHGMDEATLARIFDPYFTTKSPDKGTGLGLAVVHGIIERHSGAIEIHSEPMKGSTFHVYLPKVQTGAETSTSVVLPLVRGKERILVVDDEDDLADVGQRMFEALGYDVVSVTSSSEALRLFSEKPECFDLVITDYTMPKMTGVDLALKMLDIRPGIPIILCTGFTNKITPEKAKEIGFREFLMKPLNIREISHIVRRILDDSDRQTGTAENNRDARS